MSTATDRNGTQHHTPDVTLANDATIQEWSRRARASKHPVLRARYADLAWEIAKYRILGTPRNPRGPSPIRPNADDARRAIDGYLDAVTEKLSRDAFAAWFYLGRAVELAATIRDTDRLALVKNGLFDFRTGCERADPAYSFWQFDDIIWEQRDALSITADDKTVVIAALERSLAVRTNDSDQAHFDPITAQVAADRLRRWREQLGQAADARRAADTAGLALERAAASAPALTALAWLSRQAERYRRDGEQPAAARAEQAIRARAKEAKSELKRISAPIEIPADKLQTWVDNVAGETLEEGLRQAAAAGLIRMSAMAKSVEEFAKHAPLQAHIPISIMGDDGFPKALIGSVRDDLEGRIVYQAARQFGLYAPFVNMIFVRLRDKHGLDLEKMVGWLSGSTFFPESRRSFLRDGLSAWFAGDTVKAIYVLVPQVEAALRDLLAAIGAPVMRPDPLAHGFQAATLGEILNNDRFRSLVPEDLCFHLRVLYQDPRGINLRNEVAHGLAAYELCGLGMANWVVHSIVMVGLLRVRAGPRGAPSND